MSRIEGLYKRYYRTPETVAEERRRQEAALNAKRCNELVEDVYKSFENYFPMGYTKVSVTANVSQAVLQCAKQRLENDGLTVTLQPEGEYSDGMITAEYKK